MCIILRYGPPHPLESHWWVHRRVESALSPIAKPQYQPTPRWGTWPLEGVREADDFPEHLLETSLCDHRTRSERGRERSGTDCRQIYIIQKNVVLKAGLKKIENTRRKRGKRRRQKHRNQTMAKNMSRKKQENKLIEKTLRLRMCQRRSATKLLRGGI